MASRALRVLQAASSLSKEGGQYDVVVVGSGMGGMIPASMLARYKGMSVLVLEAHETELGGSMHRFKIKSRLRGGVGAWYTAGYHYVGGDPKMRKWLDYCCDSSESEYGPVQWKQMGTESRGSNEYDRIVLGDNTQADFVYGAGQYDDNITASITAYDDLRMNLKVHFSSRADRHLIHKYTELVEQTAAYLQRVVALKILPIALYPHALRAMEYAHSWTHTKTQKVFKKSVLEVLRDDVGVDPESDLFKVLTGQAGLYGGADLDKEHFYAHAACVDHYVSRGGGYKLKDQDKKSTNVVDRMRRTIKKYGGGECLTDCRAVGLITNGYSGPSTVIIDHKGEKYYITPKKALVLATGVHNTLKLINKERDRNANYTVPNSVSHYQVFVGFAATPDNLGLPSENVWFNDVSEELKRAGITRVFVSFSANGLHTQACIVAETSATYDGHFETDEKIEHMLMELLANKWPLLRAWKPTFQEGGNPAVAARYLNTKDGSSYGVGHGIERMLNPKVACCFHPETTLRTIANGGEYPTNKGFYISGQDVCMPGVAGAISGGVLCAVRVAGLTPSMLYTHLL